MPLPIQPLSPLDGRYQRQTSGLAEHLSEAGLREPEITIYEVHGYLTQGPTVAEHGDADEDTES